VPEGELAVTPPQAPSATPHASDAASRYQPRAIEGDLRGRHIVSVEQFARPDLDALCRTAAELRRRTRSGDTSVLRLARRKIMASLFYEASTRTDMSFQAAMLRMGGEVIATSGGVQFSSVYKGENLADTVRAIGCYADVLVLRHPEVRSSYEAAYHLDQLGARLGTRCVVISGGDGIGEHPSQALLDLFTIVDRLGDTEGLRITFVGDLANGRTVHSLAKLVALYGARGAHLDFVSPEPLRIPDPIRAFVEERAPDITMIETADLDDVIGATDVIYWTRVQEERFVDHADYVAIADRYVMTPAVLARAKSSAILMHPLPRKHEMGTPFDHAILDADPRSVYFHQMQNGMFIRMALVAGVLGASV
jgi:aspartate carbamoyltransferase